MVFDWREFLLFAHELRNEAQESKQRTSVGRAYYYAYNVALAEAKRLGYNPNRPSTLGLHKRLWSWCQSHNNADIVALGDSGNTLHLRRIEVDYKVATSASLQQVVQKQLDEARDFELLLAQISNKQAPPPLP